MKQTQVQNLPPAVKQEAVAAARGAADQGVTVVEQSRSSEAGELAPTYTPEAVHPENPVVDQGRGRVLDEPANARVQVHRDGQVSLHRPEIALPPMPSNDLSRSEPAASPTQQDQAAQSKEQELAEGQRLTAEYGRNTYDQSQPVQHQQATSLTEPGQNEANKQQQTNLDLTREYGNPSAHMEEPQQEPDQGKEMAQ